MCIKIKGIYNQEDIDNLTIIDVDFACKLFKLFADKIFLCVCSGIKDSFI